VGHPIFQFHNFAGTKVTKGLHKRHGGKQTPNELTKEGKINISRFGRFIFLMNTEVVPQNLYVIHHQIKVSFNDASGIQTFENRI